MTHPSSTDPADAAGAPAFTALQGALAAADGETVRQAWLARIAALQSRLQSELSRGLPRDSYPDWQAAAEAAQAACEILSHYPVPGRQPANPSSS